MILLGVNTSLAPTAAGSPVTLQPPAGFDTVQAVRITNTSKTIIVTLNNVHGTEQSQELLFPGMQMVYKSPNVSAGITAVNAGTTPTVLSPLIFTEWATDPANDFPGDYPISGLGLT